MVLGVAWLGAGLFAVPSHGAAEGGTLRGGDPLALVPDRGRDGHAMALRAMDNLAIPDIYRFFPECQCRGLLGSGGQ